MNGAEKNMESEVLIRMARVEDAERLLEIYGYYVEHTAITYEYDVPELADFGQRIAHTLERYPYLVAERDGEVIGYAYAGAYHPRIAYSWDAELTIYLDHTVRGNGIGQKMYQLLEDILAKQGIVKAIALITAPPTEEERNIYPSMYFHEKMGYHMIGCIEKSGYKFNRWYDTVLMDKMIGEPKEDMEDVKSFDEVRAEFDL